MAVLGFLTGSAWLSTLILFLGIAGLINTATYLVLSAVLCACFLFVRRIDRTRCLQGNLQAGLTFSWKALITLAGLSFGAVYLTNALAPEVSSDGAAYHLGLVAEYARQQRIMPVPTNFYAALSQGLEMLFLFAYVLGGHSAAALVHLAFLLAMAALILCFGIRNGVRVPSAVAAIIVFTTPVVGMDATVAYVDVAAACAAFAFCYVLWLWTDVRSNALAFHVGILAGLCFAIKYSIGIAILFGLVVIAAKWQKKGGGLRSHKESGTLCSAPVSSRGRG